jgi:hypothetical protein
VRLAILTLCVLAIPAVALAEEPKVEVMADVILASNKDTTIEPPELAKMKKKFESVGFAFSGYRRLSSQKLSVVKAPPTTLELPNQRKVSLKLQEMKEGTATLNLEIADSGKATVAKMNLSLGKEGSVFQHVGAFEGGQLLLVLTPPK